MAQLLFKNIAHVQALVYIHFQWDNIYFQAQKIKIFKYFWAGISSIFRPNKTKIILSQPRFHDIPKASLTKSIIKFHFSINFRPKVGTSTQNNFSYFRSIIFRNKVFKSNSLRNFIIKIHFKFNFRTSHTNMRRK